MTALATEPMQVRMVTDFPAWVRWAFPWGEPGTALEDHDGPDVWQLEFQRAVHRWLVMAYRCKVRGEDYQPFRYRVSSGHGIGKGAQMAQLFLFLMDRGISGFRGTVTANTQAQLQNKTWSELRKWHSLYKNRDRFEWSATKFTHRADGKTFIEALPWSEHNSQAFAGLHGPTVPGGTLLAMDEASTIPKAIYDVGEGALTTIGAMEVLFGNPTEPTGPFIDRAPGGILSRSWQGQEVDGRDAMMTNKALIEEWRQMYGEDSDFFRVRVRGLPPISGQAQFIKLPAVEAAMKRRLRPSDYAGSTRRIGVDPAGGGDNETVVIQRKGLKLFHPWHTVKEIRASDLALHIKGMVEDAPEDDPVVEICVDVTGNKAVSHALQDVGLGDLVVEVIFSETAQDPITYANVRAEVWGRMRDWLPGADLPFHPRLRQDLAGPRQVRPKRRGVSMDVVLLESKEDMAKRGLLSPDYGDATATTFARMLTDDQLRRARVLRSGFKSRSAIADSSAGY